MAYYPVVQRGECLAGYASWLGCPSTAD